MRVNRRHFFGILYDCVLFEWASQAKDDGRFTLSLHDLADTFSFVVDFYKHRRKLMDIPCDQFISRNQLDTVAGLVDYIEALDRGLYEIFPGTVELREEALSFVSSSSFKSSSFKSSSFKSPSFKSSSFKQDRPKPSRPEMQERSSGKNRDSLGLLGAPGHAWDSDAYGLHEVRSHHSHHHHYHPGSDTEADDEYSIVIPGLSKTDIQTFLWEYAYLPEDYQDDIATLIRYLRQDEWMMAGSKGSIVSFDWGLEGVQKFSREYNQKKIHKVQLREQEELKRTSEATQRQQDERNRQQEVIKEKELLRRTRKTDEFIWKMHKTLLISKGTSTSIKKFIENLEAEISEYFNYCFVSLTGLGSFAADLFTHQSDLDLTMTGNIKDITFPALEEALKHFHYEEIHIMSGHCRTPMQCIGFLDTGSGISCHLTLNDPISIHRSKLIHTYSQIEPRFGPVMVALKRLAVQRHLIFPSLRVDRHESVPLGSYALTLMLITFLQTENPPVLPKLQQNPSEDDRPLKDTIVQGVDCSFDHDWKYYQGLGAKNTKSAAELLMEFCRFFGYVFDYESKEVNARIGAFRWRADRTHKKFMPIEMTRTSSSSSSQQGSGGYHPEAAATPSGSRRNSSASAIENDVVFQVMDPFMVNLNVAASCQGEAVHTVRLCFQDAYEALQEGDMNHVFS